MAEHHEWYCLGKGFDLSLDQILSTDTTDINAREILLNPMAQLMKSIEPDSRYSKKTAEMTRQETQQHELDTRGKLSASAFKIPVELHFGIHQKTTSTGFEAVSHETEQVHTRTLYFHPYLINNIPRVLANSDLTTATEASRITLAPSVECLRKANYLSENLNKIAKDEKVMEDGSLIKKIGVCRQLLMSPRVDKATHFVSSVHLGAKIVSYSVKKTGETTNETDVNSKVKVTTAESSFAWQKKSDFALTDRSSGKVETRDTSVQMKGGDTEISRDKEKVIGVKFSPISNLVGDMWKDALEMACRFQFEPEGKFSNILCAIYLTWHNQELVCKFFLLDKRVPCFLKTSEYWLTVTRQDHIVATKVAAKESCFYINQLQTGSNPTFCIEYKTVSDNKWQCVSLPDEDAEAHLTQAKDKTVEFTLINADNEQSAVDMSAWLEGQQPFLLGQKKGIFWKTDIYLSVQHNKPISSIKGKYKVTCCSQKTSTQHHTSFYVHPLVEM